MNWTDYFFLIVLVSSGIAGLMRGLLREAIALFAWVAGVWLAWTFADSLEPHLGGALADPAVRPWAARVMIFVVVLLVGMAISAIVSHYVRLSIFNSVDRLLGFLFGLVRGIVVLGVLAILCHAVRLSDEEWYRHSLLVRYAERSGNVLRSVVGERKIFVSG
jgi:membrane protein required for colicin V production